MSSSNTFDKIIPSATPAKIIGIQFGIASADLIRKNSVAEITNRDTYVSSVPKIGGPFEPRMGVLEPGTICPTDGLNHIDSPGYFGHIELVKPVFYIQYIDTVIDVMKCVCHSCGNLLIDKNVNKNYMSLPANKRWEYVLSQCKPVKRCGEQSENGCGCLQPSKINQDKFATIIAEWESPKRKSKKEEEETDGEAIENIKLKITPDMAIQLFKKIKDEDVDFMGLSSVWSRPEWMICQTFAVPPPAMRPSIKHDAQQRSEDDITHSIVNIIKANDKLRQIIETSKTKGEEESEHTNKLVEDWQLVLQYYVATMIDNNLSGASPVTQRSGRVLNCIIQRLKGKMGRVRGNLMGKRVDFSARSVITPDARLSIGELGVPLKIAKNITRPVIVQPTNINYLYHLVRNGPDKYPGAKLIERKNNGPTISLSYVDRENIKLEIGDTVHRHMLDGDRVLFNRQPTLHRMSMMAHIVRIMYQGDTFRMNVAVTAPYNADFDGDEMNMHMPQSDEAEAELRYLANIPNHMISPGSNKPIVGIFQDYMIGSYLFTRSEVKFTRKQAMNLLGRTNARDILSIFDDPSKTTFTNFEILSAILPSISLKYKTKLFQDHEDPANSNHVLEIVGGEYKRGQLNKSVLGSSSVGLIHRIKNDYNADTCKDFIDDIQNIVNEYMLTTGFSVGISDLISNDSTNQEINKVLSQKKSEVNSLIDQTRLSIFKNDTGKPNIEEFETRVNNILGKASSEAGKIGLQTLNKDNRFVALVTSGSKGSELNISQMISCLGQQEVDGKRIPYGYNNRTLPHFKQYDDSPKGRGFVENSFIQGLEPHEVFFHAMGGRVGLIDTAVKTATTGYVQRRLIKGEEDLMVHYDNTVRNNKNKIVQFRYGGTGFDTIYIENIEFKLVDLTIDDIFNEFSFNFNDSRVVNPKLKLYDQSLITKVKNEAEEFMKLQRKTIDMLINYRDTMITKVYRNKNESTIYLPVNFPIMIKSIQKQFGIDVRNVVNITPLTCLKYINEKYDQLEEMFHPCESFRVAYMYYMNPVKLLHHYKLHEDAIAFLLEKIVAVYKKSVVNPGEMVGMVSAQSIGEPCTQMTLNTFHYAGISSKSNVTRGVPRMEELLTLTENLKNPSVTVALKKEYNSDKDMAYKFASEIRHTKLVDVISECEIYFEPSDKHTLIEEDEGLVNDFYTFSNLMNKCLTETIDTISDEDIHGNKPTQTEYNNSKSSNSIKSSIDGGAEEKQEETEDEQTNNWIIRIELDETVMIDNNITCEDIQFALNEHYQDQIKCIYTDYNSDNKLVFRIRLDVDSMIKNTSDFTQEDFIYVVQSFQSKMLEKVIIRGVAGIDRVVLRQELKNKEYNPETSDYEVKDTTYVLDTVGTNLKGVLALDYIDATKTISNDVIEVYNVLGIEAAANCIFQEIRDVIEFDNTYINHHHIQLLVDRMTCNEKMVSIYRHGINKDDIGPIAKASFEETSKMFLQAATHGELDNMRGVSANVMCGQEGYYGTACFNTLMDNDEWFNRMKEMKIAQSNKELEGEDKKYGEQHLGDVDDIDEIMKHLSMAEKDLDMCSINNFVGPDEYDDTVIEADENFMEDEDYELDI